MTVFNGAQEAGARVAIVAARFHEEITRKLVEGATSGLLANGLEADAIDIAWVPGAFEVPFVARRLAMTSLYDAVICLGVVIRGETAHFDLVAGEAARGIADASRDTGIPVIFEILAVENIEQAEARAGGEHGNKGWEAAEAALAMTSLLAALPEPTGRRGGTA